MKTYLNVLVQIEIDSEKVPDEDDKKVILKECLFDTQICSFTARGFSYCTTEVKREIVE